MLNSHIEEINECISHLMTALFIVIQNFVIVTQLNVSTYYIIKCNPIIDTIKTESLELMMANNLKIHI